MELSGIVPVNGLSNKNKWTSFVMVPSSVGILPVNKFPFKFNRSKFVRLLRVVGIFP